MYGRNKKNAKAFQCERLNVYLQMPKCFISDYSFAFCAISSYIAVSVNYRSARIRFINSSRVLA